MVHGPPWPPPSYATTSKRRITVDTLLQRHRRHFIAKVFINVVFINIFVNTPPLPCSQYGHLASSDRLSARRDPDDGNDRVTTIASTASSTMARRHRHGVTTVATLHGHTVLAKPMCARWASSGLGKIGGLIVDGTL